MSKVRSLIFRVAALGEIAVLKTELADEICPIEFLTEMVFRKTKVGMNRKTFSLVS